MQEVQAMTGCWMKPYWDLTIEGGVIITNANMAVERRQPFGKGSQVLGSTFSVRGNTTIIDANHRQQGAALLTYLRSVAYLLV